MPAGASIRKFRWSDLKQWSSLFSILQVASPSDSPPDLNFTRRFLSQPGCDPENDCFVVEADDSLVGYMLLDHELAIGRAIASGGVTPSHRGTGIGRDLLSKAVERAQQLHVNILHIQAGEGSEKARHLLETSGFHTVREYWMLELDVSKWSTYQIPPRFTLHTFNTNKDETALTDLQNTSFSGAWGFCKNTVEQITARVLLRPWEADGILMLLKDNVPVAYNWTTRETPKAGAPGKIAMTGVHPVHRSQGLGRIILLAGIDHLKQSGASRVELEVDSMNALATNLYQSVGFQRVGRTLWYEMQIATRE